MTQLRYKVKKGDIVQVITGRYKGRRGEILKVFLEDSKVLVQGVNVVKKCTPRNSERLFEHKTLPLHISNVALIDPTTDRPGRVGYTVNEDGEKVRCFKKTGALAPEVKYVKKRD